MWATRRNHLALLNIDPGASGYATAQQMPMVERLLERLRSIAGVSGATVSENGIFSGTDSGTSSLRVEGFNSTRKEDMASRFDQVGPHYFQVLGVPLIAGRDFDERDKAGSAQVAIINEVMARFYFGNRDPVGMSMRNGNDRYTIVGVVKDMKERELKAKMERRFFFPCTRKPAGWMVSMWNCGRAGTRDRCWRQCGARPRRSIAI